MNKLEFWKELREGEIPDDNGEPQYLVTRDADKIPMDISRYKKGGHPRRFLGPPTEWYSLYSVEKALEIYGEEVLEEVDEYLSAVIYDPPKKEE